MASDPQIIERARDLRRAGLSTSQIATTLGGIPTSTVQSWVAGVPPPEWTRRPRAKDDQRAEARRLRAEGLLYPEIAERLSVSKSSVSLWVRDMEPPLPAADVQTRRIAALRRYAELRRAKRTVERAAEVTAAARAIGPVTQRELLLVGAVAYWAEGNKSKPWRPSDRVVFTNSDAGMISVFLAFLRLLGVPDDTLRFRVSIHESADEKEARRYWSGVVGVPAAEFQRTTLKRAMPRTVRKNVGDSYHGCLVITVLRSASLYRQIEGIWQAIGQGATSLDRPSRVV